MSRDLAGHAPLQPALWFWKLARTAPPRREAHDNDPRRDDDHLFQDALSPQTLALTDVSRNTWEINGTTSSGRFQRRLGWGT